MRALLARVALVALMAALIVPGPVAAQTSLDRVESLIADGRVADARSALERWWEEERSDAPPRARQHGLWLRGRLSLEGGRAERDFRRLVVEHPGGPYSDDALIRLGQRAHVDGGLREAASYFRMLVRDYPSSPLRTEARSWLDRYGQELEEAEEADDAEEAEDADREAASEGERPYAVQLGAFSSERRARRLWERARSAGLDPRLARIPGSGLLRVRVGTFPDSPGAEKVLHRVRALGFEATIVTDALREEPLR